MKGAFTAFEATEEKHEKFRTEMNWLAAKERLEKALSLIMEADRILKHSPSLDAILDRRDAIMTVNSELGPVIGGLKGITRYM